MNTKCPDCGCANPTNEHLLSEYKSLLRAMNWHTGHIGEGEYRREVIFDANHGQIAEVTMTGTQGVTDAELIAAAPAMYAALKRLVSVAGAYKELDTSIAMQQARATLKLVEE